MMYCDLHEVAIDRRGCPWCEIEQISEQLTLCNTARKTAEEEVEALKIQGQNLWNESKENSYLRVTVETMRDILQQIANDETGDPQHLAKLTLESNP